MIVFRHRSKFFRLFNPHKPYEGDTCCLHFIDKDTEAQMVKWLAPRLESQEPRSQVHILSHSQPDRHTSSWCPGEETLAEAWDKTVSDLGPEYGSPAC